MGVTSEAKLVSPEQAKEWIETSMYKRQRQLPAHHVIALGCAMLDGTFAAHKPIVFALLNGQRYCVDGQHTLHAIVESQVATELLITEHELTTEDQVADLYGRLDRGIARTFRDALIAQDLEEETGLPTADLTRISGAVALIAARFRSGGTRYSEDPRARSVDARHRLIREWTQEARAYFEFVQDAPREVRGIFRRAAIIGIALVTIRDQPEKGREFWLGLAMDNGLERDDPRKTLLRTLTTRRPDKPEIDSRLIALAWNAFYRGDRLQLLRVRLKAPLRLLGTEIDGSHKFVARTERSGEGAVAALPC
jgi:hypothetical protein